MAGLPGVDVASYQGTPGDWTANAGLIQWAAVKFTELEPGGYEYTDPDAADDWAWLASHGKGRIAYLFGHPSVSAADQVDLLAEALDSVGGLADADGVALDFEVTDGRAAAEVATWAQDLLALMQREFGRLPVVYTFLDFAWSGYCAGLAGYPLWIADPAAAPGQPTVPDPWSTWAIHQYAITGAVDRDVTVWGNLTEMAAAVGKTGLAPPPADVFTGEDDDMLISLPPGERVVFGPWPALAKDETAPYEHVSLVLTGETGATVEADFYRGGTEPSDRQTHQVTSGAVTGVAPEHAWAGITAVTLARTDSDETAMASAVLSRW